MTGAPTHASIFQNLAGEALFGGVPKLGVPLPEACRDYFRGYIGLRVKGLGFPKIRSTFLRVLIRRIMLNLGVYIGVPLCR